MRLLAGFLLILVACASPLCAQQQPLYPRSTEWTLLAGGAARVGGAPGGNFGALHLRWGRVLSRPYGPAFLRGTFEVAAEAVPLMAISQSGAVYGAGLTPLILQHNFAARRAVPFFQIGAGMLLTSGKVPPGTSQFNFTPQGGPGIYLFTSHRTAVVFGLRWHHVSNAGIRRPNPGRNTLFFYSGISRWR